MPLNGYSYGRARHDMRVRSLAAWLALHVGDGHAVETSEIPFPQRNSSITVYQCSCGETYGFIHPV